MQNGQKEFYLYIDTEECFKNLTGIEAPKDIPNGRLAVTMPNGDIVVIRSLGDSGQPKVEINAAATTKTHEKITFKD